MKYRVSVTESRCVEMTSFCAVLSSALISTSASNSSRFMNVFLGSSLKLYVPFSTMLPTWVVRGKYVIHSRRDLCVNSELVIWEQLTLSSTYRTWNLECDGGHLAPHWCVRMSGDT